METETPRFKNRGFLGGIDFCNTVFVERVEPFHVAVRLGGDEREILVIQPEGAGGTLFGLFVEL